ncbi:MAG: spermidine/putrescine ABC transporter substrate-binding protein [Verrucomicrobiota bacterium]
MIQRCLIPLFVLMMGCASSAPRLHLFVWSEYIPPEIITGFEKQFHCTVAVDLYEDPDSMVAKLAAGGTDVYDIVIPSDTTLPGMVQRGLLAPLRRENIPNLDRVDPRFASQEFDRSNRFSAPIQWGTVGIFLRRPTAGQLPDESWSAVFDPAKQPGPFLLMEDIRACIGAALRYKGYSMNTTNRLELAEARDLLIQAKKRSLGFEGGTGCKNRVLSGDAALAMAYNGDAARGMREDGQTYFFVPKEGSQIWVDVLSIPAKAPHRDLAEKFINYLLEPQISARLSNHNRLATTNREALPLIDPADRDNPAIYPPPEVIARLDYSPDLGRQNSLYDDLWTEIKSR